MPTRRWDALDDLINLRHSVNRLMEESMERARPFVDRFDLTRPATDVYETDEAMVIEILLPGVDAKDVEISMTGNLLTIKAEVRPDAEIDPERYMYRERRFGPTSRTVRLVDGLLPEEATAKMERGILKLSIPKCPESQPKIIRIRPEE